MVTMPQEIPACGRRDCQLDGKHRHDDWQPGDRVVVTPKLATAPGWAYANPRGAIVRGVHSVRAVDVVTVQLDDDEAGVSRDVDWHLLIRERAFDRRQGTPRKAAEPKRKHALDPEKYDEPTLGDYMLGR